MNAVALAASVALGIAFLVAGGSKIAAGPAWASQAAELGAPAVAVPALPWLELVVGAALAFQIMRSIVALAAIGLLVAFSVLIARRLAEGKRPACACFGAWSAKPIGPGHLVRNAALAGLGVLTLLG